MKGIENIQRKKSYGTIKKDKIENKCIILPTKPYPTDSQKRKEKTT